MAEPPRVSPRSVAIEAIARAAKTIHHRAPESALDTAGLDHRDARLACAIHRTTLQRWLSLEYLLERYLRRPIGRLEPALQGVLLSAAAQLVFMDRLPSHAVVHESVTWARQMVRAGAGRLANAVLRRVAELVDQAIHDEPWRPAPDRLPLADGYISLTEPCLPDVETWDAYLSVATSQPVTLVRAWIQRFGRGRTTSLCLHHLTNPPTIVALEPAFSDYGALRHDLYLPHKVPGFLLWRGSRADLQRFLAEHPARRVQDSTTAQPVDETQDLAPHLIIDACAGRGTKTRQLAAVHPTATILATEVHPGRRGELAQAAATLPCVRVVEPDQLPAHLAGGKADLILLDVPCSNTGVLARRPEARYRYGSAMLSSLVVLQRQIVQAMAPMLASDGVLLYSTCSLEPAENQDQVRWISRCLGARLELERCTLPEGADATYCDGGYYARLRKG